MSRRVRALWAGAVVCVLGLAASGPAQACSVCMSGREDENQLAFLLTTIFLSAAPVVLVGAAVWAIRRRYLAVEAKRAARKQLTEPPGQASVPALARR